MTIADLRADLYRIPLPAVLSDSTHGAMSHFELITVRVRDADGREGLGYTYTVGRGGRAVESLIRHELSDGVLVTDPRRVERTWDDLWWRVHWVGRGGAVAFALAAIDIALWDLKAKVAQEPLWRLLGGADPRVKCYAGGIDLDFPIDALLDQTRGFQGAGFRAIKVKAGRDRLREDVARIRAVRELVGPDFVLMVDANMRWSVDQAIRACRELREFGLFWVEEPTIPEDVEGHARIAVEGGLPIATGENLHSVYEFTAMMDRGRIAFPEPDAGTLGGITPFLKVAHMAQARFLPVTTHGIHDIHVQLLAAVPNASYLEIHGFGLERFQREPMRLVDGVAVAPNRPGHGVELDWERLEPHRVRS